MAESFNVNSNSGSIKSEYVGLLEFQFGFQSYSHQNRVFFDSSVQLDPEEQHIMVSDYDMIRLWFSLFLVGLIISVYLYVRILDVLFIIPKIWGINSIFEVELKKEKNRRLEDGVR